MTDKEQHGPIYINADDPSRVGAFMLIWLIVLCWFWCCIDRYILVDNWWVE